MFSKFAVLQLQKLILDKQKDFCDFASIMLFISYPHI